MIRAMRRAFTLVEILIVVVILGILAAIVVPLFSSATKDAEAGAAIESLGRTRRILAAYYVRNGNSSPTIIAGTGMVAWGEMGPSGYLKEAPVNPWVGKAASEIVVHGPGPDAAYHQNYGWIFDPSTGDLWAAAFDAQDQPLPRP